MKAVSTRLADRLLRLLRADPAVYRPVARAHTLILRRRTRFAARASKGFASKLSPFVMVCVFAAFSGCLLSSVIVHTKSHVLGASIVLTFGAIYLLLVVTADYFDVLVNRDEYLVLAAHPHDAWSVLLAKMVVLGRSLLVIGACYFTPGAITTMLVYRSGVAGIAFLIGAAQLTVAIGVGGMLFAGALLAVGGRRALNRVLPMFQAAYILVIALTSGSGGIVRRLTVPRLADAGIWQWILPPLWFVWPLEAAVGEQSGATRARALLSAATLVGLVLVGSLWIARKFGERLLEPETRAEKPAGPHERFVGRARRGRGSLAGRLARSPETRALLTIARAHLRGDLQFRSQVLVSVVLPLAIVAPTILNSGGGIFRRPLLLFVLFAAGFIGGSGILIQAFGFSTRPGALWCILASPADRSRLSMATVRIVRTAVLLPFGACLVALAVALRDRLHGAAWIALEVALFSDCMLVLWRGLSSEFPFSRESSPGRRRRGGAQLLTVLATFFIGGIGVAVIALAAWLGTGAQVAALGLFVVARLVLGRWASRRVSKEAVAFEIGGEGVTA